MGQFLKSNAMQIAGAVQVVVGIVLAFTHWSVAQVAAVATLPTGVSTFLVGIKLAGNGKTNGLIRVFEPSTGHVLAVDTTNRVVADFGNPRPGDPGYVEPVPPPKPSPGALNLTTGKIEGGPE